MGITAIVQNYYEERQGYWPEIVGGMEKSTMRLESLLIWDNWNREHNICFTGYSFPIRRVLSPNTLLGRYAAVLIAETEYVFVQDNDLVVGAETVERMYGVAEKNPGKIVGAAGCLLAKEEERPYRKALWVKEGECDVVLGRCFLAHRKAFLPGLRIILEEGVRPGRCDDILMSMAGGGGIVVPCENRNLDERGVGLSWEPTHFEERDAFVKKMLERR